jgi:hypothetical protein
MLPHVGMLFGQVQWRSARVRVSGDMGGDVFRPE